MWKSEERNVVSTIAIYPKPKNGLIDIGPYKIDLWRYLKTELWNNWKKRTKAPYNYMDTYFCYA